MPFMTYVAKLQKKVDLQSEWHISIKSKSFFKWYFTFYFAANQQPVAMTMLAIRSIGVILSPRKQMGRAVVNVADVLQFADRFLQRLNNKNPRVCKMKVTSLLMSMIECLLRILVKQIDHGSKHPIVMMMEHNSMNQHRNVGKQGNEYGHQTSLAVMISKREVTNYIFYKLEDLE